MLAAARAAQLAKAQAASARTRECGTTAGDKPPKKRRSKEAPQALAPNPKASSSTADAAKHKSTKKRRREPTAAVETVGSARYEPSLMRAKRKKAAKAAATMLVAEGDDGDGFGSEAQDVDARADGLDSIFGEFTSKRIAREEAQMAREEAEAVAAAAERKEAKRLKSGLVRDNVFGETYDPMALVDPQHARVHRVDNESGFNVYKAHHLGLGRGGGTPLCPFDCKCCF